MKRKQPNITINLTANAKETSAEELKKLYDVLYPQKVKTEPSKLKKADLYILNKDIEKLHERYEQLFKQVKNSLNLSEEQIANECETLSRKYYFELEELSKMRKLEYVKQQAEIEAREDEQTPWRRGWWWRLIFKPLTNRAQDIIERRAELEAQQEFAPIEKELDKLAERLYVGTGKKLSKRKRQRLMKKYLKLQRRLISAPAAPPAGYEQTATSANPAAPAPAPTSATEKPARDAVHHGGNVDEHAADNVPEPPEPPARKPRQNKNSGA